MGNHSVTQLPSIQKMLTSTKHLLETAQTGGYAIGAFNVYNLEGVTAVLRAATHENSPVILQIHPKALAYGGPGLVALCLAAGEEASVPVSVHLDHSSSEAAIQQALAAGISSVMADGSHHDYAGNVAFTRQMTELAHRFDRAVEAELGRIGGTEDGLTVAEWEARLTQPDQAAEFVAQTHIDALAVCIGNVHGKYHQPPNLDFARLAAIREQVDIPLVLHGTSGLPDEMIVRSIELGVCKFNVNTEVRNTFVTAMKEATSPPHPPDLLIVMEAAIEAMTAVITQKLRLFGSVGKAS